MYLVIGALLISGAILLILGYKYKDSKLIQKYKNKIFWSSILRALIQSYFPMSIQVLTLIKETLDKQNF